MNKILTITLLCLPLWGLGGQAWAQTPSGNWTDEGNYSTDWRVDESGEPELGYNIIYIDNAQQLAGVAYKVNKGESFEYTIFRLASDLDMSAHYWTPIGTSGHPLLTPFDGQGHTIAGITVDRPNNDYNGLFGYVAITLNEDEEDYDDSYRYIKNIVLRNCSITGKNNTGGAVGYLKYKNTVSNVYCDATVSGADKIGGVVGTAATHYYLYPLRYDISEIKDCLYMSSSVTATGSNVGALCGYYEEEAKNTNSYYTSSSFTNTNSKDVRAYTIKAGEIPSKVRLSYTASQGVAYNQDGQIVNGQIVQSFYAPSGTTVTIAAVYTGADQYVSDIQVDGVSIAAEGNALTVDGTKDEYVVTVTLTETGVADPSGNWTDEGNYTTDWRIEYDAEPTYGYHYIYINNEQQLAGLAHEVNNGEDFEECVIKLTRDLDMSAHYWTPVGTSSNPLYAPFDGQGHTIKGITVNRPDDDYNGLFGYVAISFDEYGPEYRRIQNLTLTNCKITGKDYTGGVAGYIFPEDRLTNVYCDATVSGADKVGGLLGYADGSDSYNTKIEKCLYLGNSVTATSRNVGAICGYYNGDAKNSGSYYTSPSVINTNSQDVRAYTIKKGNIPSGVTISFSGGNGINYDNKYYVPKNETVTVNAESSSIGQDVTDIQVDGVSIATNGAYSFMVDGTKDEYVVTVTVTGIPTIALYDGEDNSAVLDEYVGQTVNVTYDRVLSANSQIVNGQIVQSSRAYTVCLPYDLDLTEQVNAGKVRVCGLFYVKDNREFVFSDIIPELKAGLPYLIVVNEGEFSLNADGVVLANKADKGNAVYDWEDDTTTSQLGTWRGTFTKIESADAAELRAYALQSDGTFKRIRQDTPWAWRGAFRCMFCASDDLGNNTYKAVFKKYIAGDDDSIVDFPATGFEADADIQDDESVGIKSTYDLQIGNLRFDADAVYDLQGRTIENSKSVNRKLPKGVYIHIGKKVVIK